MKVQNQQVIPPNRTSYWVLKSGFSLFNSNNLKSNKQKTVNKWIVYDKCFTLAQHAEWIVFFIYS